MPSLHIHPKAHQPLWKQQTLKLSAKKTFLTYADNGAESDSDDDGEVDMFAMGTPCAADVGQIVALQIADPERQHTNPYWLLLLDVTRSSSSVVTRSRTTRWVSH